MKRCGVIAATIIAAALCGCSARVTFAPIPDYRRDLCDPAAIPLTTSRDPLLRTIFRKMTALLNDRIHAYGDIDLVTVRNHSGITTAGVCHRPIAGIATILLADDMLVTAAGHRALEHFVAYFVGHELAHLALRHQERATPMVDAEREADQLGAFLFGRNGGDCAWLTKQVGTTIVGAPYEVAEQRRAMESGCRGDAPPSFGRHR